MYVILSKENVERQLNSIQALIDDLRSVDISDPEKLERLAWGLSEKSDAFWDATFAYLYSVM